MIVSGAETESKDFNWLQRHIDPTAHCVLTNVTSGMGVLSIMGPRARELLQSLTPDDMSDRAFPFATSRVIELGYALVRASRITLRRRTGLGNVRPHRIHAGRVRRDRRRGLRYGLVHAGYHALNSLRIEKAYRHSGHDITDEDTPWEAGLGFRREARQGRADSSGARRCCGSANRACASASCNSSSSRPSPCSITTSRFGGAKPRRVHPLRNVRAIPSAPRWVSATSRAAPARRRHGVATVRIDADAYEIEVAGVRQPAIASLRPLYDPKNLRIKR